MNQIYGQPTPRVPGRSHAANEIVKGIVGTVPVDENGSVAFRAPAGVPLQFQALDDRGMAVMTMRSQAYLLAGEFAGCVGCHEPRESSPGTVPAVQGLKTHDIDPPDGPQYEGGFSFMRTVQPVLDRHCIKCHGLAGKAEGKVNLLNEKKGHFANLAYQSLTGGGRVKIAQRNRETWYSQPKDYFAHASRIPAILRGKHSDKVKLDRASWQRIMDWLDVNAQFYGDYSHNRIEDRVPAAAAQKELRDHIRKFYGDGLASAPIGALVNWAAPDESRILNAPLGVEAGGWGQLKPEWKSKSDAGYQRMRLLVLRTIGSPPTCYVAGTCGRDRCSCGGCWVRRMREATRLVRETGSDPKAWIAKLKAAPLERKIELLRILGEHSWEPAYPAALQALKHELPVVRTAAIVASARLGREKALPSILDFLAARNEQERQAAARMLESMPGAEVSAAIARELPNRSHKIRLLLISALEKRNATGQVGTMVAAAKDKSPAIRLAAIRALGRLAPAESLPDLLEIVVKARDDAEREAATRATMAACDRVRDHGALLKAMMESLPNAPVSAQCSFLRILARTGGEQALTQVRQRLTDTDSRVQNAAIRALGDWKNSAPLGTLLKLTTSAQRESHRRLALQGYLRLARQDTSAPIATRLKRLENAMKAAADVKEKKQVLAVLSEVPDPGALRMVEKLGVGKDLRGSADASVVAIAELISASHWEIATEAARSILDFCGDKQLCARAKVTIERIQVTHPVKLPGLKKGKGKVPSLYDEDEEEDDLGLDLDI